MKNRSGQTAVEYLLIIAAIVVVLSVSYKRVRNIPVVKDFISSLTERVL
jgi:Flp pilus assembly pilin Flp